MNSTAIFLCDLTGVMAEPWIERGYDAILVDPQHPEGITVDPQRHSHAGKVVKVGHVINHPVTWQIIRQTMQVGNIAFVMGFPPCTDVAVSGSKHFAAKAEKDKHFQARAALVAEQCRTIGELSGARWAFENPVSVFSSIFGKPKNIFSPYQFTGFCSDDNYFKTTCLWDGGGFEMPEFFMQDGVKLATEIVMSILGRLPADKKKMLAEHGHRFSKEFISVIEQFYPDDRIHKAAPGPERANFRSATPEGFARAVFKANSALFRNA